MKRALTIIALGVALVWLHEGVYLGSYHTPATGSLRGQKVAHEYLVCRYLSLLRGYHVEEYWPPGTDRHLLDRDGELRSTAQAGCPKRWPWEPPGVGLEWPDIELN